MSMRLLTACSSEIHGPRVRDNLYPHRQHLLPKVEGPVYLPYRVSVPELSSPEMREAHGWAKQGRLSNGCLSLDHSSLFKFDDTNE